MLLAGDIGGTSTRLAIFDVVEGHLKALVTEKYSSQQHEGLNEIVRKFLAANPTNIENAAFGIAGPVRRGRVEATNLPWIVDTASLASEMPTAQVSLLNDLEANTYGIFELPTQDFAVINPGSPAEVGNVGVISAGTGLGEAGAVWDGTRFIVFATEGGHTDFAPRNEIEIDLLLYVRGKLGGRVSYERVLSGPGFYVVYQFLRDSGRGTEEPWLRDELAAKENDSAVVAQHALDGDSELCVRALELFCELYGAEAGNLALKLMASRGIFVGGGDRAETASLFAEIGVYGCVRR